MIVDFGDIEYILTSDPEPTGRDREWKADAKTIDGHAAVVYWMADDTGQIDLDNPVNAELT